MGYKAEKDKIEKKWIVLKRVALGILLFCILALCIFSSFIAADSWKYRVGLPNIPARAEGEMRLHFLDVGQGDCALVEFPDGKTMLVDGGDGSKAALKNILRHLRALDIDKIDYLTVTHADGDHSGGLKEILKYVDFSVAFLPPESLEENAAYAEFYAELVKTDCERRYVSREQSHLGASGEDVAYPYAFSFLYPYGDDVEAILSGELKVKNDNLYSGVFWLDYCGVSALFTGDAPTEVEEKLMRDDKLGFFKERGVSLSETEILKVAHHGSEQSTSAEFLEYLGVETAIVSCGENVYGHPDEDTLERLQESGAEVFRTDEVGSVILCISKEGEISVLTANQE